DYYCIIWHNNGCLF
nr:immunoglobulin light chain junction region [Macaca mulatta]MOY10257.1 immunoglobulin light chain junction region [Macaca mulatta]